MPIFRAALPVLTDQVMDCLKTAIFALIIPLRILLFTLHNFLTKRDYTYSIDDICDVGLAGCILLWVYNFFAYQSEPIRNTEFEDIINS